MRRLLLSLGWLVVGGLIAVILALNLGPREAVDRQIAFDPSDLPDDPAGLDAYLSTAEAQVADLRPAAARRIHWAGAPGSVTDLSIVYLHGFSASSEEIRPVPDRLAEALRANLHFARLTGHGRNGPAMAEATAGDWIEDTAEALEIGRRIGRKVIVIGTSTGGTLAALVGHDETLREGVAGIVFVSPNFAVNRAGAALLTLPWARIWLPRLLGETSRFEPRNEGHAAHWTHEYPVVSVVPMAALVDHVRKLDHAQAAVPALFVYSEHDAVVSPAATGSVLAAWGAPKGVALRVMGSGDDPNSHVIAGDILSPGQTDETVALILDWARGL
ncbi:MAG: alpha/beta fold hydrolase [Pseudomonadota bacterium]